MTRQCCACGVGTLSEPRNATGFTTSYRGVDVTLTGDFPIRVCDHCHEPSVHMREIVAYGEACRAAYFARTPRCIRPTCDCGAKLVPNPEPECFEDEFVCSATCGGVWIDRDPEDES